jgi:hypothetical protein
MEHQDIMDPGGLPPDLIVTIAGKEYVRAVDCDHERVREVYGDTKGLVVLAARGRNGAYIRRRATSDDNEEFLLADYVRNVLYQPVPEDRLYRREQDGNMYVAFTTLQRAGASEDDLVGTLARAGVLCTIGQGTIIKPSSAKRAIGRMFVTVSKAAATLPHIWPSLFAIVFPGAVRARLPEHVIRGAEGTWVSPVDLFVACDELGVELPIGATVAEVLVAMRADTCHARVESDGLLSKRMATAANTAPFVSVAWLSRTHVNMATKAEPNPYSALVDHVTPSDPNVPIMMADGLKRTRNRKYGNEDPPPGCVPVKSRLQSSVKMTLAARLKDKRTRDFLETIVDSVSAASRFGSYLLNLHLARVLDGTKGRLSDSPAEDPFDLTCLVSKAMRAVRDGKPKDPGLAMTYQEYETVMKPLVDPEMAELGNCFTRDSQQYVTNTLTTFQLAGPNRVVTLLNAVARLVGGVPKGMVRAAVNYVRHFSSNLDARVPPRLREVAQKYREMYAEKSLNDVHSFYVHDMPKNLVPSRVRRILELYWHINQDLVALETEAVEGGAWVRAESHENVGRTPSGPRPVHTAPDEGSPLVHGSRVWRRSSFAFLPVSSLKRRHVRIDTEGFVRACERLNWGQGIKGFTKESFMSLFACEGRVGRKKKAGHRSEARGWSVGASFRTDGTSLVFTYECSVRRAPPKREDNAQAQHWTIPEGCIVVGDDPGRQNMHTTCTLVQDGDPIFRQLTREDYYRDSKFDENRISGERRRLRHAAQAIAAMSGTRRRTAIASEFAEYVGVIGSFAAELKAAYACRSACSEAFKAYRFKTKTIDTFIVQHKQKVPKGTDRDDSHKVAYLRGDAKFDCTGRGERAVPTTSYGVRLDKAHKALFHHIPVDEWNTTKMDAATHTELSPMWRTRVVDGVTRYIMDRDVKLCTSEYPMESHSFLVARGAMLDGLMAYEGTPIDRDRNSAFTIAHIGGLSNAERPLAFQRPD